jgi:ubiquitin-like 1-activating enzyme E1 A
LAHKWDEISKKVNIPYYNLVCCGLYSFAYISLGSDYNFVEIDKKDKKPIILGKI